MARKTQTTQKQVTRAVTDKTLAFHDMATETFVKDYVAKHMNLLTKGTLKHAVKSMPNTPPATPTGLYIVGSNPTGAWAGHAAKIALYNVVGKSWMFIPPDALEERLVEDQNAIYQYQQGTNTWVEIEIELGGTTGLGDAYTQKISLGINNNVVYLPIPKEPWQELIYEGVLEMRDAPSHLVMQFERQGSTNPSVTLTPEFVQQRVWYDGSYSNYYTGYYDGRVIANNRMSYTWIGANSNDRGSVERRSSDKMAETYHRYSIMRMYDDWMVVKLEHPYWTYNNKFYQMDSQFTFKNVGGNLTNELAISDFLTIRAVENPRMGWTGSVTIVKK